MAAGWSLLLLAACSNHPANTNQSAGTAHDSPATAAPAEAHTDPAVGLGIKAIVDDYLAIKNALVSDNEGTASAAAGEFSKALAAMDKSHFTPAERSAFEQQENGLREHSAGISATKDIAGQREHFSRLSENVYALTKSFGGGRSLYHDHCPMFGDKGANWLSETAGIRNPYLGAKMPDCGTVEDQIK